MQNYIDIKNLSYFYEDGTQALKNISITINPNECIGLAGANGAGKSTLLSILGGLLFDKTSAISFFGEVIDKNSYIKSKLKTAYVFQNPDDQLFMTSVYDDVAFGPQNLGLSEEEIKERTNKALRDTGIDKLKTKAPYRLSGGEKKAAAIASVLSMNPELLILDEPTSSLDPASKKRIMSIIKNFSHTRIFASHDIDLLYNICSRVIILSNGQIIADGNPKEILSDQTLMEKAGLELPLALQNCPRCGLKKTMLE